MLDLALQAACLIVWLLTLPFFFRQSRRIDALQSQLNAYVDMRERTAAEYQRIVRQLMDCSAGINKTLHDHDKRLRTLAARPDAVASADSGGPARYREAVDLLRRGGDEDDLIGSFGLSRGEAHLIAHLERLQNRVA